MDPSRGKILRLAVESERHTTDFIAVYYKWIESLRMRQNIVYRSDKRNRADSQLVNRIYKLARRPAARLVRTRHKRGGEETTICFLQSLLLPTNDKRLKQELDSKVASISSFISCRD